MSALRTQYTRWLKWRRVSSRVVFQVLVSTAALTFTIPLMWLVLSSLSTNEELQRFPPKVIPDKLIWSNYPRIWEKYPFALWYKNTLFLAGNAAVGAVVSNAFIAYGFSRVKWRGRDTLFMVCLATMMLPGAVTQIPVYIVWNKLGMIGTWLPLTLGAWLGSPYFIFLLVQFFRTIPDELSDAARVDGCSSFRIFYQIMLPLCRPALAVIAFFAFNGAWNNVIGPLIYIQRRKMFPIALGIRLMRDMFPYGDTASGADRFTDWSGMMVGTAFGALPVIVLFYFTQRTFIEGITFSGIKG